MTDGAGSEAYTYNNLGRVTQLSKIVGTTTYNINYAFNIAGELTQITYPSGRIVQQSFDAIGRLCEIAPTTTGCGAASTRFATGYTYNVASQLTAFNYGNTVAATFGYSADRLQLTSLTYKKSTTTLFGLTYSYGTAGSNNGQITGITDSVDNGRTVAYTYDPLTRLSTAVTTGSTSYPKWGLSFAYDRYGNRTDENQTAGNPPMNHVIVAAATNRITGAPYAYDLSGNMTNDGSNTMVFDGESRTASATGASSGTYTYDGNNLRVKKVSGSTTTVYIFAGSKVIAEYQNGAAVNAPTREYIYSGATLLAKIEAGATNYYHPDHLSPRLTTDSSGTKVGEQAHYPFGESWYSANTTTKWQFTSYERDAESGNDYAMARYNVNRLGRFSSADPLAGSTSDPQSLNRYAYVLNNPINFVDPTGLKCGFDTVRGIFACDVWEGHLDPTFNPGYTDPSVGGGGGLSWTGGGVKGGRDGAGRADISGLKSQALVSLLKPDCAALFGGFRNAVTALFSSSYNNYTVGQTNPYPGQISNQTWSKAVNNLVPTSYGFTTWSSARPGGFTFFTSHFNDFESGFPTSVEGFTQFTGFLHELEHAANHSAANEIDSNYRADQRKINEKCTPKQIDTERSPSSDQLTPP